MLKDLQAVLTFSAFRPEPDDPTATWRARFAHRRTVLVHVGRNRVSYKMIDRHGVVVPGRSKEGEPKEGLLELAHEIKDHCDEGWCAVSLDTRYVISLESNLSRKQGSEQAIRKDPRSVLHARYERGRRYSVTHSPESNASILLAYDEENLKRVETNFREGGLKIGRILCGAYVLLRHALTETNQTKGSEKPYSALYVACCSGSVCALLQEKDNWIELRSRPDVYGEDIQPLIDLLRPFHERMSPEADVVLVCDEPVVGLQEKLSETFPQRNLKTVGSGFLLGQLVRQY